MVKDLHVLIRLHKFQVDEKRRALGQLLGQVAALEQSVEALEDEIISEQKVAAAQPEEAGFIYGAYAEAALMRREYYTDTIAEVENNIVEAQEDMREEFKELKVLEITQEARDEIEASEEKRQENAFLDEIGQKRNRRGKLQN